MSHGRTTQAAGRSTPGTSLTLAPTHHPPSSRPPPISNRNFQLLEIALTPRKHSPQPSSNRNSYNIFSRSISCLAPPPEHGSIPPEFRRNHSMRAAIRPPFSRTSCARSAAITQRVAALTLFALAATHFTPAQSVPTQAQDQPPAVVHIDTTPTHAINSFDPDAALGSTLDVLSHSGIDRTFYAPHSPGISLRRMGTHQLPQ